VREVSQRIYTEYGQRIIFAGEGGPPANQRYVLAFNKGHVLVDNMRILGELFFEKPRARVLARRYYHDGKSAKTRQRPEIEAEDQP